MTTLRKALRRESWLRQELLLLWLCLETQLLLLLLRVLELLPRHEGGGAHAGGRCRCGGEAGRLLRLDSARLHVRSRSKALRLRGERRPVGQTSRRRCVGVCLLPPLPLGLDLLLRSAVRMLGTSDK